MAVKIEEQIDEAFEFLPEGFALCFTGPSGTGKTYNVSRLAKRFGYHVVNPKDPTTQTNSKIAINFYDEAQMMKRIEQEKLLTLIDGGCSYQWTKDERGIPQIVQKPAKFIFATTHLGDLIEALRTRCIEINFGFYSPKDMAVILKINFPDLPDHLIEKLVKVSKGTPRQGVKLGKYLVQLLQKGASEDVAYKQALRIVGVNEDGFTRNDLIYLTTLFQEATSERGTISEKGLSQNIGIDIKTVRDTIESYLIREKFIQITNKGRKLTPLGNDYVREKVVITIDK